MSDQLDTPRDVATDGGRSQFEDGPRECPYEEDYQHWVADGLLVVHGHPVGVVCDCGDAMTFDAFYGAHNETAGFTCGCGLDFVLTPAKCTPDHWECFADGGHEATFLLTDDGEYHFGLEHEDADDLIFRVQATTMTDDEPAVATDGGQVRTFGEDLASQDRANELAVALDLVLEAGYRARDATVDDSSVARLQLAACRARIACYATSEAERTVGLSDATEHLETVAEAVDDETVVDPVRRALDLFENYEDGDAEC